VSASSFYTGRWPESAPALRPQAITAEGIPAFQVYDEDSNRSATSTLTGEFLVRKQDAWGGSLSLGTRPFHGGNVEYSAGLLVRARVSILLSRAVQIHLPIIVVTEQDLEDLVAVCEQSC